MVGIFIAGGVESSQKEIVKAMVYTICKSHKKCIIFTTNKGSKLKYLIDGNENAILVNLKEFVDAKTWPDKYKIALKVLDEYKIENMFIMKHVMLQTYNYKDNTTLSTYIAKWKTEPEFSMKFQMLKNIYEKICFITAIAKKCKTIELVIDPQQINASKFIQFKKGYKQLYILNKQKLELQYGKFYEPYYIPGKEQTIKEKDFCFACTAITKDRKYIAKYANKTEIFNKDWLIKIVTDNKNGKKLSQTEYYEWLKKSKFTLIIPSYDISTFSIIRFIEALKFNCIPLIHKKCNLQDLVCTFPTVYDIINKKLLLNSISEIQNKINVINFDKTLDEIKKALEKDKVYDIKLSNKIFKKVWRSME